MELIPAWVAAARSAELPVGVPVSDALTQARDLRRQVRTGECPSLDFQNADEVADVLYAVCRSLLEDCVPSPKTVLEEAVEIRNLLDGCRWADDDLEERKGLLCSLAFICWRSARILGLSKEAQRWEAEYRRTFRGSIHWDVAEAKWGSVGRSDSEISADVVALGPEAAFQLQLYLHERLETSPEVIAARAIALYYRLQALEPTFPSDIQTFLLGNSARLWGGALRNAGQYEETNHWLDVAEAHFRSGVDSAPQLARLMLPRMAMLYALSRFDLVARLAPVLDRNFAKLGMEEDQVKCRIVWSAALKVAGRCEEALGVLEPLRQSRSTIRPALYGWVLLELGDLHQICGNYELGRRELQEAAEVLRQGEQFTGLANVNAMIGCGCRAQGLLTEAVALFKSSQEDYARLGMRSNEAYVRLLIAETYLAMGNPRGAEHEARAALPILDEQAIAADAVAAISILREAIRRQKLEPQTLTAVRERLRPKQ